MQVADKRQRLPVVPILFLLSMLGMGCSPGMKGKRVDPDTPSRGAEPVPQARPLPEAQPLPEAEDRLDLDWARNVMVDDPALSTNARLVKACIAGDLPRARKAVDLGADPARLDALGRTPLMYAAKFGHREIVAFLCSLNVDVNARRPSPNRGWPRSTPSLLDLVGGTALIECAMQGDTGIARILLEHGAEIGADGYLAPYAALFQAVNEGHADMVDFLMERSKDTIPLDWEGEPVLSHAVRRNRREVVERLLRRKRGIDAAVIASALCAAADSNNAYLAEKLLETGRFRDAVYTHDGFTPLIHASRLGRLDLIRFLMKHGADVNREQENHVSALSAAAAAGQADVVRFLLESGARPDTRLWDWSSPLSQAIQGGHPGIVRMLLQSPQAKNRFRSDIARHGFLAWPPGLLPSLFPFLTDSLAIDFASDDSLAGSLRAGLDNAQAPRAVLLNVIALMQSGAIPDFGKSGLPKLTVHAVTGEIEAMKRDLGEDTPRNLFREITLNSRTHGRTALDWAIYAGKREAVKFLVESGAELNPAPDPGPVSSERTRILRPLEIAFEMGDAAIIAFLIDRGARTSSDTLRSLPHPGLYQDEKPPEGSFARLPLPVALALGRHYGLLEKIALTKEPSFNSVNLRIAFLIASVRGDSGLAEGLLNLRPELANDLFRPSSDAGAVLGEQAFVFAAAFDHVAMLDLIMRKTRPPSGWSQLLSEALAYAERCGRKKATAFILRRASGVAD